MIVFGLGKDLLFKSVLGRCGCSKFEVHKLVKDQHNNAFEKIIKDHSQFHATAFIFMKSFSEKLNSTK